MAAPASDRTVTITAGGAGALGAGSVGIEFVAKNGKSAQISVGGKAAGTNWSTHLQVAPDALITLPGLSYRVAYIVAPDGGHRGEISFVPADQAAALPADTAVLAEGGVMMLGGPEIEDMTSLRIKALAPNDEHPNAADIEWWPAVTSREDADPAAVHSAHLTGGAAVRIGTAHVALHAIMPKAGAGGASVVLAFLPG